MSVWSERLNDMDTFHVGNENFRYIRQVIIQNISKIFAYEKQFREMVQEMVQDLSEYSFKMPPNDESLPAVGYLSMRVNEHNLTVLSRLDDGMFGGSYIVVMPYVFTNDPINNEAIHVDFSKSLQRPSVNVFINTNYPFNTAKSDYFKNLKRVNKRKERSPNRKPEYYKQTQSNNPIEKYIFNRRTDHSNTPCNSMTTYSMPNDSDDSSSLKPDSKQCEANASKFLKKSRLNDSIYTQIQANHSNELNDNDTNVSIKQKDMKNSDNSDKGGIARSMSFIKLFDSNASEDDTVSPKPVTNQCVAAGTTVKFVEVATQTDPVIIVNIQIH